MKVIKRLIQGTALVTLSIVFSLAMTEIGLRLLYPKYAAAAEAEFQRDSLRITSRPPNTRRTLHHPDNGKPHLVIYNNYGMRQHRDFGDSDLETATNVGFFGDSYLESYTLPAPYVFVEPLDYLLNESGLRFNVLNFGQSGYGTDQSYISYKFSELGKHLDHVYYVFCINDIRNIYENNLFHLDDSGRLHRNPALEPPWWIRSGSRLHLTYLMLDAYHTIKPRKNAWERFNARVLQEKHADDYVRDRMKSKRSKSIEDALLNQTENQDVGRSLNVFQAILREWRDLAKANGADFTVVLLPTGRESAIRNYIGEGIRVIDLYEMFDARIPDYDYDDWNFENDGHWAEAANELAALFLYKDIMQQAGRTSMTEAQMERTLETYYSAFDYGWMPERASSGDSATQKELQEIRSKYTALEVEADTVSSLGAPER